MVSDAIRQIRDAETEAEEAERRARAECKRLIADAHEGSERFLEEMRHDVREEEKALVADARADAEREASVIATESRTSIESVRRDAEEKVGLGVKKVLETIVTGA